MWPTKTKIPTDIIYLPGQFLGLNLDVAAN